IALCFRHSRCRAGSALRCGGSRDRRAHGRLLGQFREDRNSQRPWAAAVAVLRCGGTGSDGDWRPVCHSEFTALVPPHLLFSNRPMLADTVVAVHFLIVLFIVAGLPLVYLGVSLKWAWVRSRGWRALHLGAILFVAAESLLGITCPLTAWEDALRGRQPAVGSPCTICGASHAANPCPRLRKVHSSARNPGRSGELLGLLAVVRHVVFLVSPPHHSRGAAARDCWCGGTARDIVGAHELVP